MSIKGHRPNLFKGNNSKSISRRAVNNMKSDILDNLQVVAQSSIDDSMEIKRMPNYLEVTERQLEKQGIYDMKKSFARSSKRKRKKDGGWYLVVPIRVKTSKMSHSTYQDLRKAKIPSGQKSVTKITDYLEGRQKNNTPKPLQPPKPSANITKVRRGQVQSAYYMFRTVSDKSPPGSWIMNRDKANENNLSKTTMRNIERLMKFKLKNMK